MPIKYDWNRLAPQSAFLSGQHQFSVYSGAVGTGKTSALCAKVIALSILIPDNNGYLGRKDGKSLRQTTVKLLLEMMPKEWLKTHDRQQGMMTLTKEMGGSTIIYGDLKDRADMMNHDLGWFAFDQMEEVMEDDWNFFVARLRRRLPILDEKTGRIQYEVEGNCKRRNGQRHWVVGEDHTMCPWCGEPLPAFFEGLEEEEGEMAYDPPWKYVRYPRFGFGVCNTENPDHWIYRNFTGLPGTKEGEFSEGLEGYQAYTATTYDSLRAGYVDREFVEGLEIKYAKNPLMRDRYLLGKWVTAEGLVFPTFNKIQHVYHQESVRYDGTEIVPRHLPVFEYIDPGVTAVTAIGWIVIEICGCGCGRNNFWLVAEHYVASPFPRYHCEQMKKIRGELRREVVGTYMDSQAFSKTSIEKITETNEERRYSISQLYIENEIFPTRNQKDWDSGYSRFLDALAIDPLHTDPFTGVKGAAHFHIASHCIHWQKECLNYKWKPNSREDEPVDGNDHHMDGTVGFFAGRPEFRVAPDVIPDRRSQYVKTLEEELDEYTLPVGQYDW